MKLLHAIIFSALASVALWGAADPSPEPPGGVSPAEIVDRYVKAVQAEQARPQAVSMDVDMDASLPRLKKEGRFHAFRFITRVGQIFYQRVQFQGDSTIKKEVIARYLQAEKDARNNVAGSIGITPENYNFKYKGTTDYAGRTAYVFQVNPRKKKIGLYKGELWIDRETHLPLREWGELVKSPSVFLKNVYFVRDYMIYNGISVPRRVISDVNTRIAGKAKLTIWYENVKVGEPSGVAAEDVAGAAFATTVLTGTGGGH
ncbi:MAG: sigma-E factor regulatory protein RseB domain-containing protein [Acidobacteriota bacterium]